MDCTDSQAVVRLLWLHKPLIPRYLDTDVEEKVSKSLGISGLLRDGLQTRPHYRAQATDTQILGSFVTYFFLLSRWYPGVWVALVIVVDSQRPR